MTKYTTDEERREAILRQKREYYQRNKEQLKQSTLQNCDKNKEKMREMQKRWYEVNKEKVKQKSLANYYNKKGVPMPEPPTPTLNRCMDITSHDKYYWLIKIIKNLMPM